MTNPLPKTTAAEWIPHILKEIREGNGPVRSKRLIVADDRHRGVGAGGGGGCGFCPRATLGLCLKRR